MNETPEITLEKPEEPKPEQLSRRQIGQLHRRYWTVELPRATKCGHRLDPGKRPQLNCECCWEVYFTSLENVTELHETLVEHGKRAAESKYGTKVIKAFQRYLNNALLPKKEETNVIAAENQVQDRHTPGSSENV